MSNGNLLCNPILQTDAAKTPENSVKYGILFTF